jgi:pimeloyl-ACP methyl ester carboxylesterase
VSHSGRVRQHTLTDGRILEYWDGGDPAGRPVLEQPGTPATYALSLIQHDVAMDRGVRLVVVNRPGYGESSPSRASLAAIGRDAAELAQALGWGEYAVVGTSGGGPFASATAFIDRRAVRVLGVLAGVGPWRDLEPREEDADERALWSTVGPGGPKEIRADYRALFDTEMGALRDLSDEARVEAILARFTSPLAADPAVRRGFAENFRVLLDGPHGFDGAVTDCLAYGGAWDIDVTAITAATLLWYGESDTSCPPSHGEWYAERIAGARLTTLPGLDHLGVCAGSWALVLDSLLATWDQGR